MTRALVLGATGLVGRHLIRELGKRGIAYSVSPFQSAEPIDYLFNAIGFTDIERAERQTASAYVANATRAASAAVVAHRVGAVVVHVSTEFVFDGNKESRAFGEGDVPAPRSVYAKSKREGEIAVERSNPRHHIVRLQNLYGDGGRNLLSRVLRTGLLGVLDGERRIAPMWAGTAARLVCDIAQSSRFGLWHATCAGSTTYGDFAARMNHHAGAVVPSAAINLRVPRPSILLECERLRALGAPRPTWEESLGEYLSDKEKTS